MAGLTLGFTEPFASFLRRLRIRRGAWKIVRVPPWVPFAIQVVMFEQLIVRGTDYALGDSADVAKSLGFVEADLPLVVWGLIFLSAAALFGVGITGRWSKLVIASHVLAGAAYLGVGYGLLEVAATRNFDGLRTSNGIMTAGLIHLLFAAGIANKAQQARIRGERGRPAGCTD